MDEDKKPNYVPSPFTVNREQPSIQIGYGFDRELPFNSLSQRKSRRESKQAKRELSSQLRSARLATSSINSNVDLTRIKNEALQSHEKHQASEAYQVGQMRPKNIVSSLLQNGQSPRDSDTARQI